MGACGKRSHASPHQLHTGGERGSLGEGGGVGAQAFPNPHLQFCRAAQPSGIWHLQSLTGYFLFDLRTRVDLIIRRTKGNKVESHLNEKGFK